MKLSVVHAIFGLAAYVQGFMPAVPSIGRAPTTLLAKYNSMDEILAKFPEDKPVLINFYDANTENAIKNDIFRAKEMLKDRATLVSIKQQDYPELAAKWDCNTKSPAMILFQDGKPVARLYERTDYLDILAKFGQYCNTSA